MPRRSRPVEYDDVVDDIEHGLYPGRVKGGLQVDRDAHYAHRPPNSPPVEIFDRRHFSGRPRPEIPHESYEYLQEDARIAEGLGRLNLDAYPPEVNDINRGKTRGTDGNADRPRGRSGSRLPGMEEAYFSTDESDSGYTDSQSDKREGFARRQKRPVSRHGYDIHKEPVPRSKGLKESRVHQSRYDGEMYIKSSRAGENSRESRGRTRYDTNPQQLHRSHYHVNLGGEEDESNDCEEDAIPRHSRRGVARRNHIKQKYPARSQRVSLSSSSSTSSSSAELSDSELPKVPLPPPVPPVYKNSRNKSINHATSYRLPSPPRVPSLETVLNERDARHRRKMEKSARDEVEIQRRSKDSLKPAPESHSRRRKDATLVIDDGLVFGGDGDILIEDERTGASRSTNRQIVEEEDYYRRRQPKSSSRSSLSSETMDGWAIVQAPSKAKHAETELVDIREEPRQPKQSGRSKVTEKDERDLGNDDTPRGKVKRRYIGVKDRKDRLWTEITKDLVVKEAIERAGYEYEEMDSFYYIFSYLHPDDVDALIEQSDDIRRARRRRLKEIHRERGSIPPSSRFAPNKSGPLHLEPAPSPPRQHRDDRKYREDRRRREREEEIKEDGYYRARSGRW
ncbi:uncharacterized protein BJX67DRAFT_379910 [Aspergillus lucknowensis]|uniref:DUF8035 domain-containing protein n=1 Tax=Aspergillus lucknowensis TaxID=176173 RepID=A0ABR4LVG1_9EURO